MHWSNPFLKPLRSLDEKVSFYCIKYDLSYSCERNALNFYICRRRQSQTGQISHRRGEQKPAWAAALFVFKTQATDKWKEVREALKRGHTGVDRREMMDSGEVCEEERGSAAGQEQDKFHKRTGRMQEKLTDDAILRGD